MKNDGKSGKPVTLTFDPKQGLIWGGDMTNAVVQKGLLISGYIEIEEGDLVTDIQLLPSILGDTSIYDLHTANQAIRWDLNNNTIVPQTLIEGHDDAINDAVHQAVNHFRLDLVEAEEDAMKAA